jgi:hypothetical protein
MKPWPPLYDDINQSIDQSLVIVLSSKDQTCCCCCEYKGVNTKNENLKPPEKNETENDGRFFDYSEAGDMMLSAHLFI